MIWVLNDWAIRGGDVKFIASMLTIFAGITMVSNVRFYSFKDINLRRAVPFWVVLLLVMALLLISIEPSHVLWGLMLLYGVSGYGYWAVQRYRRGAVEKKYENIRDAVEEGNLPGLARMLNTTPIDAVVAPGGVSLLAFAVEESNLPAVELIISRGAALDLRDEHGSTALAIAVEIGFEEAVEMLLAAGANPNLHDTSGMTPLDIADEHGAHDIAAVLLRNGPSRARNWLRSSRDGAAGPCYSALMNAAGGTSFASWAARSRRPCCCASRAKKTNPQFVQHSAAPEQRGGSIHPASGDRTCVTT
jgi:Ca2+/Na+ antiporter